MESSNTVVFPETLEHEIDRPVRFTFIHGLNFRSLFFVYVKSDPQILNRKFLLGVVLNRSNVITEQIRRVEQTLMSGRKFRLKLFFILVCFFPLETPTSQQY